MEAPLFQFDSIIKLGNAHLRSPSASVSNMSRRMRNTASNLQSGSQGGSSSRGASRTSSSGRYSSVLSGSSRVSSQSSSSSSRRGATSTTTSSSSRRNASTTSSSSRRCASTTSSSGRFSSRVSSGSSPRSSSQSSSRRGTSTSSIPDLSSFLAGFGFYNDGITSATESLTTATRSTNSSRGTSRYPASLSTMSSSRGTSSHGSSSRGSSHHGSSAASRGSRNRRSTSSSTTSNKLFSWFKNPPRNPNARCMKCGAPKYKPSKDCEYDKCTICEKKFLCLACKKWVSPNWQYSSHFCSRKCDKIFLQPIQDIIDGKRKIKNPDKVLEILRRK